MSGAKVVALTAVAVLVGLAWLFASRQGGGTPLLASPLNVSAWRRANATTAGDGRYAGDIGNYSEAPAPESVAPIASQTALPAASEVPIANMSFKCVAVAHDARLLLLPDRVVSSKYKAENDCVRTRTHTVPRYANHHTAARDATDIRTFETQHPAAQYPGKYRRLRAAVLVPLDTCFSNMWHGTIEFLLPLMHAILAAGIEPRLGPTGGAVVTLTHSEDAPLVAVEFMKGRRGFWGGKGCMPLHQFPFGFIGNTTRTPTSWMLRRLSSAVRFTEPVKAGRTPQLNLHDDWTGVVDVDTLVIGLNRFCASHLTLPAWPFFDVEGSSSEYAVACTPALQALRAHLRAALPVRSSDAATMRSSAIGGTRDRSGEGPARGKLLRTLRVVFWDRSATATNGRKVANLAAVIEAFQSLCEEDDVSSVKGDSPVARPWRCDFFHVVAEDLSIETQLQVIADTDVFIISRGAGSVYTGLMPPHSAYMTLFPYRPRTVIAPDADNYPWWPFPLLRRNFGFRALACRVVERPGRCATRTVNFCDIECSPAHARRYLAELLAEVWHKNATSRMPPVRCSNATTCVYDDFM